MQKLIILSSIILFLGFFINDSYSFKVEDPEPNDILTFVTFDNPEAFLKISEDIYVVSIDALVKETYQEELSTDVYFYQVTLIHSFKGVTLESHTILLPFNDVFEVGSVYVVAKQELFIFSQMDFFLSHDLNVIKDNFVPFKDYIIKLEGYDLSISFFDQSQSVLSNISYFLEKV